VISTLLTGVLGAPLFVYGLNEKEIPAMEMTMIIGGLLIVTCILQRFTAGFAASRTRPGTKDAVLLGVVQSLSVFPGLSRSGLTVSALLFRRYEAIQAIRLSFLMSIPVVLAAEIGLALIDGIEFSLVVIAGVLTAFVLGLLTISLLIRIATRVAFWKFCVVLGIISLFSPLFA
jgi:undecaprenyl-diphosphatase